MFERDQEKVFEYLENYYIKNGNIDFWRFCDFLKMHYFESGIFENPPRDDFISQSWIEDEAKDELGDFIFSYQISSFENFEIVNHQKLKLDHNDNYFLYSKGINFSNFTHIKQSGDLGFGYINAPNISITGQNSNFIDISNVTTNQLDIYTKKFSIQDGIKNQLNISDSNIGKLIIDHIFTQDNIDDITMIIRNIDTDSIEISGIKNVRVFHLNSGNNKILKIKNFSTSNDIQGQYMIYNQNLEILEFNNLNNSSKNFILQDLEISELIIRNSDLGQLAFNNVKIGKLTLLNAGINDIRTNGVEFLSYELCNKIVIDNYGELQEEVLSDLVLKDNYRQLKHVMDNNGNHTEANKFFAREMEYYGKTLDWSDSFLKKINFILQKYLSDFGNDWIRPIFWIIILGFLPILVEGIIFIYYNGYSSQFSGDGFYNNLILPFLRNISVIPSKLSENDGFSGGEILYSIFMIYLIYLFILSLKRTSKR